MRVIVPPAEEMRPPLIPEAVYRVRCIDAFVSADNENKPQIEVKHEILSEGPDPSVKTVGRSLKDRFSFDNDWIWKMNSAYIAVAGNDIPSQEYELEELANLVMSAIRGAEFSVTVKHNTSKGNTYANVRTYIDPKKAQS